MCALPEMIIADDAGICAGGMRCGFSCSGFRAAPGLVLMFSLESKPGLLLKKCCGLIVFYSLKHATGVRPAGLIELNVTTRCGLH